MAKHYNALAVSLETMASHDPTLRPHMENLSVGFSSVADAYVNSLSSTKFWGWIKFPISSLRYGSVCACECVCVCYFASQNYVFESSSPHLCFF